MTSTERRLAEYAAWAAEVMEVGWARVGPFAGPPGVLLVTWVDDTDTGRRIVYLGRRLRDAGLPHGPTMAAPQPPRRVGYAMAVRGGPGTTPEAARRLTEAVVREAGWRVAGTRGG